MRRRCSSNSLFPRRRLSSVCSQDLNSALKAGLSGSLEALLLGLMKSAAQYDATELKSSMKVRRRRAAVAGRRR